MTIAIYVNAMSPSGAAKGLDIHPDIRYTDRRFVDALCGAVASARDQDHRRSARGRRLTALPGLRPGRPQTGCGGLLQRARHDDRSGRCPVRGPSTRARGGRPRGDLPGAAFTLLVESDPKAPGSSGEHGRAPGRCAARLITGRWPVLATPPRAARTTWSSPIRRTRWPTRRWPSSSGHWSQRVARAGSGDRARAFHPYGGAGAPMAWMDASQRTAVGGTARPSLVRSPIMRRAVCPGSSTAVTNATLTSWAGRAGSSTRSSSVLNQQLEERPVHCRERIGMLSQATASYGNVGSRRSTAAGRLLPSAGAAVVIKACARSVTSTTSCRWRREHRPVRRRDAVMPTNPLYSFLSSSLVKDVVKWGGEPRRTYPTSIASG